MLTYFLHMVKQNKWYWTVMETNSAGGRTIARSVEGYSTKEECQYDIDLMKASSADALIKEIENHYLTE